MERVRQLGFEGEDWKSPEIGKGEMYYAYCTVCSWKLPHMYPEAKARNIARSHNNLTGHCVLLQGEKHYDTEAV